MRGGPANGKFLFVVTRIAYEYAVINGCHFTRQRNHDPAVRSGRDGALCDRICAANRATDTLRPLSAA
jgi:hypothetical protein